MAEVVTSMKEQYREEIAPALFKEFEYESPMQVPRVEKIVVNVGLGEALDNAKATEFAVNDITLDHGSEAGVDQGQEVHRPVQAA